VQISRTISAMVSRHYYSVSEHVGVTLIWDWGFCSTEDSSQGLLGCDSM